MTNHHQRTGFTFKQFHVAHENCAMKVGTDAILLGAWTPVSGITRILDIGTGSGILALMLAQRTCGTSQIDALDINEDAVKQAECNRIHSPWADRIRCIHGSLQDYIAEPYDLLISNPPFFRHGQTLSSPARQIARHTEQLSHQQLLSHAARRSHDGSTLALILPCDVAQTLVQIAPETGWHLAVSGAVNDTAFTIRNTDGSYSPAFIDLSHMFYLNM